MTGSVSTHAAHKKRFSPVEQLTGTVRSRGPKMCSAVVRGVFDIYKSNTAALSEKTLHSVDRILVELIAEVELSLRAEIARNLMDVERVPAKLVEFLADDDLAVAKYVLLKCPAVDEQQLQRIALSKTEGHRKLIAGRAQVSPTLAKILIDKNEAGVINTVVKNLGAALDEEAVQTLLEASRTNQSLCEALLRRPELGVEHAHAMFWWVSSALRTHILSHYDIGVDVIDRAVQAATHEALLNSTGAEPIVVPRSGFVVHDPDKLEQFTSLFRNLEGDQLSTKLAETLDIREATAHRILNDKSGEALGVCCKALNANRQQFVRIFLVIDYSWFREVRATGYIERITRVYDAMTSEQARRTLNYWDLQSAEAA